MSKVRGSAAPRRLREMIVASLLAAMTAGTAFMSVPFGPVPVTLQTMFVLLAGLLLAPAWAAASMLLYLVLGLVGLPVFSGNMSGLAALGGPTGGFLLAFPIAAAVTSATYRALRGSRRGMVPLVAAILGVVLGEVAIYAIGVPWLMNQLGISAEKAIAAALVPFILPDAIKAAIAVTLAQALERAQRS